MGQVLSMPLIAVGACVLVYALVKKLPQQGVATCAGEVAPREAEPHAGEVAPREVEPAGEEQKGRR